MTARGDARDAAPADAAAGGLWQFGDAELDERRLELRVRGAAVALERKPLELLLHLLRNPGEVATKEELFAAVWPGRIVTEASLTKAVARVREALGDADQALIRTVHGYGYRLVAAVRQLRPAQAPPPPPIALAQGDHPPARPHWKLLRRLGGGGYGEVWLAEHAKTRERRVFKFGRDQSSLAALKREITLYRLLRDALGERREFLRLLDWNLEEPPFFIESEHAGDGNLAEWAGEMGGIGQVPMAERLRLVAEAAEALAAAHSVGVLHKDLKPANLLVARDEAGRPYLKLCDFGSGRVLDPARLEALGITRLGFTQTQALKDSTSGTPAYLPPEVAAGQPPTVQADIYALGVILYQVVVGDLRRPLAAGWERGVADEVLREDIVAAASGDPAQRLANAGELAQRLRTLETRRAARAADQARALELERARLRRGWLRAVAATFLAGFVASSLLYWEARRERRAADAAAALATAVSNFLTEDLLSSSNPMIVKSPDVRVRDVLDAAAAQLPARFAGQPRLLARLQRVLGSSYVALAMRDKAEPLLRSAEVSLRRLAGDADAETQATRLALEELYEDSWDTQQAQAVAQRMVDAETAAGNPNPGIGFEARAGLIAAQCLGKADPAWAAHCDEPMRALADEARARLGARHRTTLRIIYYQAALMSYAGQGKEALPLFRQAYDGLCAIDGADHPRCLEVGVYLGQSLIQNRQYDEGVAFLKGLSQRLEQALPDGHPYVFAAKGVLANGYESLRQFDAAAALYREVYAGRQRTSGADAAQSLRAGYLLARALDKAGRADEAGTLYADILARDERAQGADAEPTLVVRDALGRLYAAHGRLEQAENLLRRNLELGRASIKDGRWLLGQCEASLGEVLVARGRRAEAEPLLADAVACLARTLGGGDERTLQARAALDRLRRT